MSIVQQVCNNLYQGSATTFADFANCGIQTMFGLDYVAFGFVALLGLTVLAYYFRLNSKLALVFGFTIVYMFDILAGGSQVTGGSQFLQFTMILLGFGMAIVIATGLMSIVKEYA